MEDDSSRKHVVATVGHLIEEQENQIKLDNSIDNEVVYLTTNNDCE
jgi:hypothetical protein